MPQPIEAQAVGGLRMPSALSLGHAHRVEKISIVGPHKSESYHERLIMHLFRTNIHDLQINKCLQSLYV